MSKHDVKRKNTAEKMDKALIRLLEQKEFNEITVTDVCQEAGVNRTTFYAHYDNMMDLLNECKSYLFALWLRPYQPLFFDLKDIGLVSQKETFFISPKYIMPYLEAVKNNKKIYKIYSGTLRLNPAEDADLLFENIILPVFRNIGYDDPLVVEYMSQFYLQGITSIITKWVDRDCADDQNFICELILDCVFTKFNPSGRD